MIHMVDKVLLISGITFKEGIRDKALHGIIFIALLSCVFYVTVVPMFAFETGKVVVDIGFASLTIAGLAIVLFLGINLLTADIHRRTVCMILSRPVSRAHYIVGKFLGMALIILISVAIISGLGILSGWLGVVFLPEMEIPRNFTWRVLLTAVLFNYLSLLIIMAVAFLFTVITTNSYLSMLFTLCVYVIGYSLETIVKIVSVGDFVEVSGFYLWVLKALMWIFPNLKALDLKVSIAYGLPLTASYSFWCAVYGISYILIVIAVTIAIFNRREIR